MHLIIKRDYGTIFKKALILLDWDIQADQKYT